MVNYLVDLGDPTEQNTNFLLLLRYFLAELLEELVVTLDFFGERDNMLAQKVFLGSKPIIQALNGILQLILINLDERDLFLYSLQSQRYVRYKNCQMG